MAPKVTVSKTGNKMANSTTAVPQRQLLRDERRERIEFRDMIEKGKRRRGREIPPAEANLGHIAPEGADFRGMIQAIPPFTSAECAECSGGNRTEETSPRPTRSYLEMPPHRSSSQSTH
jgi:hypothetical protein